MKPIKNIFYVFILHRVTVPPCAIDINYSMYDGIQRYRVAELNSNLKVYRESCNLTNINILAQDTLEIVAKMLDYINSHYYNYIVYYPYL